MTIAWLVALPLVMALVVLLLRGIPLVTAPLSAAALVATAVLLVTRGEWITQIVLGRSVGLTAQEASGLAFCCVVLALLVLYSYRLPQGPLSHPLALVAMGAFILATMVHNSAIGGLLLELGAIAAVMLVPTRRQGSAMAAMRALVMVVLAMPLILIAAWAAEAQAVQPNDFLLAQVGGLALSIGFGIALAIVPFFLWMPSIFRYGSPLAMVMLGVVYITVVLLRLGTVFRSALWPGDREFFGALLLAGGVATTLVGSLLALFQRSLGGVLAYAALADLGMVLLAMKLDPGASAQLVALHLGFHGLATAAACMALGVLRDCQGGDDPNHWQAGWRRAPLSVASIAIGGLSLAGVPLTAGFTTRLLIYRSVAAASPAWAMALIACSFGPAWAMLRFLISALSPAPISGLRRESLGPALLALIVALGLLLLGVQPRLLSLLPLPWLQMIVRGVT